RCGIWRVRRASHPNAPADHRHRAAPRRDHGAIRADAPGDLERAHGVRPQGARMEWRGAAGADAMKPLRVLIGASAGMVLAGCGKSPITTEPATPTPEMKQGHPVVHVPP